MIKMCKEYWKDVLIIELFVFSVIGLVAIIAVPPVYKWISKKIQKIILGGEKEELIQKYINGKPVFYENGTPIMELKIPKNYHNFTFLTLLVVIFSCIFWCFVLF